MDIFSLLDSLQTIARNGLQYPTGDFDRERYERLLEIATRSYSELLSIPAEDVKAAFRSELGHITPKVGTDAAIFNDKGEILLVDRSDGTGWCLPCGFVEPNETPAEGIVREVKEETGLDVTADRLVGVFTRKPSADHGPHTTVAILHLCSVTGGSLRTSHETREVRFWKIDRMKHWHRNHAYLAHAASEMWKSDKIIPAVSE